MKSFEGGKKKREEARKSEENWDEMEEIIHEK